ncbi:MAG: sugar phosphate isomerase/epimerase [Anaerolineae bacterium]|nr:sugar phosphate isomerase/epimerase [Anaerolineae bacterium]
MTQSNPNGHINRIGMSTGALFPNYHTEDALTVAAEYGFSVVEIYLQTLGEYTPPLVAMLKQRLEDLNLRVHSLHNDIRHYHLWSPYARRAAESQALFERLIDIAAELGAQAITWHGFQDRVDDPAQFEHFAAVAERFGHRARQAGVTLTIENVSWCYLRGVEQIQQVRDLDLPLGFTFDPFQAAEAGQDPARIIHAMNDRLTTVHLSDYGSGTIRHLPLGDGIIAWGAVFQALDAVDYQGPLIVEAPYRGNLDTLARGRTFVRQYLHGKKPDSNP